MRIVELIFAALSEKYPGLEYLADSYSHCPVFENAVVKAIRGKNNELTSAEKQALRPFLVRPIPTKDSSPPSANNFATTARNKEQESRQTPVEQYRWLHLVQPTSCAVERLFSRAKLVYAPLRKRLLPRNIEIILYLLLHKDRWSADTVVRIRKLRKDDRDENVTTSEEESEELRRNGEYDEYDPYENAMTLSEERITEKMAEI